MSILIHKKINTFGNDYTSSDITNVFEAAVRKEIAESQKKGNPVARYDVETKRVYLEVADGSREYIDE